MNRIEAIREIIDKHGNCAYILSNGLTSREAVHFCQNDGSFYMLHAMGEALSVGMGLASACPDLDVVVIDGDGNALMGAASWVMNKYTNLQYYVLANKTYATTGGQHLPKRVDWPEWCNKISIDDANRQATPNPPHPEAIWAEISVWLTKRIGKKNDTGDL